MSHFITILSVQPRSKNELAVSSVPLKTVKSEKFELDGSTTADDIFASVVARFREWKRELDGEHELESQAFNEQNNGSKKPRALFDSDVDEEESAVPVLALPNRNVLSLFLRPSSYLPPIGLLEYRCDTNADLDEFFSSRISSLLPRLESLLKSPSTFYIIHSKFTDADPKSAMRVETQNDIFGLRGGRGFYRGYAPGYGRGGRGGPPRDIFAGESDSDDSDLEAMMEMERELQQGGRGFGRGGRGYVRGTRAGTRGSFRGSRGGGPRGGSRGRGWARDESDSDTLYVDVE